MAPSDDNADEKDAKLDGESSSESGEDEDQSQDGDGPAKAEEEEPAEPLEEVEVGPDGWLDLMDGKIRLRYVKEGTGGQPEVKQDVRCSVEVRAADPATESGEGTELLVRWPEVRYRLGEGEAAPCLELGLRYMKEGAETEIFGSANMAWGPTGLKALGDAEKGVPPDTDVRMRVKLIEVMTRENPSWNDIIQEVTWRKVNGNDYYKRQEHHKALRSYAAGVQLFTDTGMEPPETHDEAHREQVRAVALNIVADCGANLAATHLELNNAVAAKASAEAALDIRPEHMKSIYRLAKASFLLDEFDTCEDALARGFALDSKNSALLQVQADLRHKEAKYQARSKKVAGKVFNDLGYPDLVAENEAERKQWEEDDRWINVIKQTFFEWFDAKVAAILAVSAVLLAICLLLAPKRYWPMVLVCFVLFVPLAIGLYTGSQQEEKEAEAKAAKAAEKAKKKS